MPQTLLKRAILAVALCLAVGCGAARAQDAETVHPYLVNTEKPHPVLKFFHIPGCWASHNGYSCSSFQSENVFFFGSCRAFFGEPCLNGPPPPPWDPTAGAPPPQKAGCNCRLP